MKQTAVVILNYNGAGMLRRFLPSVIKYSPEASIYVADNGSSDESCDVVRNEFPAVKLMVLDHNYGFAEGYNRALAQVDEEYAVLLNSDVEVTRGWLSPMTQFLDSNPEVAACQPKLLSFKQKDFFEYAGAAGGFIDKWGYTFCRGRIFNTVERDSGQYDDTTDVFWATGAALMIRNEVYKNNGGLDGRFFAHMEEIDLCWRLRSRGYRIACVPQSHVYHVGGATLKKENPQKTYLNFRNNLLMIYKNAPDCQLKKIMLFRKVFDNVAALKFLASGDYAAFKAVRKARRDFKAMRSGYDKARAENMKLAVTTRIPEVLKSSILYKYYLGFKHTYSSLK
jgi:GT2 family glycosyltransferase